MKKYNTPEAELLAFLAKDAIMSSNENESDRDIFMDAEDLIIGNVQDI
jgi:hypothetical protein